VASGQYTTGIQRAVRILEYFRCMIGNTAGSETSNWEERVGRRENRMTLLGQWSCAVREKFLRDPNLYTNLIKQNNSVLILRCSSVYICSELKTTCSWTTKLKKKKDRFALFWANTYILHKLFWDVYVNLFWILPRSQVKIICPCISLNMSVSRMFQRQVLLFKENCVSYFKPFFFFLVNRF
jgi:hypothetical protein